MEGDEAAAEAARRAARRSRNASRRNTNNDNSNTGTATPTPTPTPTPTAPATPATASTGKEKKKKDKDKAKAKARAAAQAARLSFGGEGEEGEGEGEDTALAAAVAERLEARRAERRRREQRLAAARTKEPETATGAVKAGWAASSYGAEELAALRRRCVTQSGNRTAQWRRGREMQPRPVDRRRRGTMEKRGRSETCNEKNREMERKKGERGARGVKVTSRVSGTGHRRVCARCELRGREKQRQLERHAATDREKGAGERERRRVETKEE